MTVPEETDEFEEPNHERKEQSAEAIHSDFKENFLDSILPTWVEDTEGLSTIAYKASDNDFSTVGATVGEKEHKISFEESYWNVQGQNPNAPQGGGGGYLVTHTESQTPMKLLQPSIVVKRWHRTA